jgi:hypothetical protein
VRYERLRADTVGELDRLLKRWGLEVDDERIRAAVAANDLEVLRREGKELTTTITPDHFDRGGVGTYRELLTDDVIADIEWRFEGVLRRWGHPLD